jgi:hypothetical protein
MTAEEKIAQKKAPKGAWAKFMQFLSKRAPAFFIRLGEKLLAAGALATIPFAGWVGAALNLAIAVSDLYILWNFWKEYSNLPDDAEVTSPTPVNAETTQSANSTSPVSTPTTSGATTTSTQSTSPTQTSRSAASTSPTPSSDSKSDGSMQSGFGANSIQDIVPGGVFTSAFTPAKRPNHKGWDIAAPTGTPVKIPLAGNVSFAGATPGFGNHIEVDHGDGKKTTYSHLSKINVAQGQAVTPGQVIGAVGNTGESRGSHLHFGIKEGSQNIDPITFFKTKPRDTPDHQLAKQGNSARTNVASNGTPSLSASAAASNSLSGTENNPLTDVLQLMGAMMGGITQSTSSGGGSGQQTQQSPAPQPSNNSSITDVWDQKAFELFFAYATDTSNIRT